MARKDELESDLTRAALAMEEELQRFEELCLAAAKTPLRSRKSLERAAKQLEAVAESDDRLTVQVQALLAAIQAAKARKDDVAAKVSAAALVLQERTARYQQLMTDFAGLGHLAAELGASAPDASRLAEASVAGSLYDRLGDLAAKAESLRSQAASDDFDDVASDADSLRQQLLATRNRLKLALERDGTKDLPV